MNRRFLFLSVLFLISLSLSAEEYLYGEFIYNLNIDMRSNPFPGISADEFEDTITDDYETELISTLLEEARRLFSGMIYGYTVVYTPSDISRSVDRYLEVNPIAQIEFGDPQLESYDTYLENNYYHLFIRYRLDTHQQRRIEYWNSGVFESASAYGRYPLYSEDSRVNAVNDGIRVALENLLKPEEFNKPRLIEAEVLLRDIPSFSVDAGNNRAFVKLRVDLKKVQHYLRNN